MKTSATKNIDAYVACSAPQSESEKKFVEWVRSHREMGYGRMMQMIGGVWFELLRPSLPEGESGDIAAAKGARLIPLDFRAQGEEECHPSSDPAEGPLPLRDLRHLHLLNRGERRQYLSRMKGQSTMKLNLLNPVEAFEADDTVIMIDGRPPTVKELVVRCLRTHHQALDGNAGLKEKSDRYLLLKRIQKVDEIELTDGEVKMIMERAGRVYAQVEIVGRLGELLSPPPVEAPPVPALAAPEAPTVQAGE